MFFCEACRAYNSWPTGLLGVTSSMGACEVCHKYAACYDEPSYHLPPPKRSSRQERRAAEKAKRKDDAARAKTKTAFERIADGDTP